ncbi:MAG: peptidoglycan-binding domain-containing protein [Alphaproteobacteria bacterium]
MRRWWWLPAVLAGVSGFAPMPAQAADSEGRFAGHGWAAGRCEALISAVESEESVDRPLFVGWIAGYLTGANVYQDDTFDIAPLAPPEIIANIVMQQCERNPDAAVVEVMVPLAEELSNQRLRSGRPVLDLSHEGRTVRVHQEIFRRTQGALKELGFYDGAVDGAYGPQSRRALTSFQEARGLEPSGLPDERTLVELFFNSSDGGVAGGGDG